MTLDQLRSAIAQQDGQPFGSTAIARKLNSNPDRIGQLLALHARELGIAIIRNHPRQYRATATTGDCALQTLLGYRMPDTIPTGRHIEERHSTGSSFTRSHLPAACSSAFTTMEFA